MSEQRTSKPMRYECSMAYGAPVMDESPQYGEWVRWEDYERLTAHVRACEAAWIDERGWLRAERDRLQQECARIASENACRMISERRLRAALEWYANPPDDEVIELYTKEDYESLTRRAREALAGGKHD